MSSIRINLGEPLRFRVETEMRKKLKVYAKTLTAAAGHPVSIGGAVRDLVARGLEVSPDAAYLSGFREGFVGGYAEAYRKLDERARNQITRPGSQRANGPIGPHPSRDNDDYRTNEEGE